MMAVDFRFALVDRMIRSYETSAVDCWEDSHWLSNSQRIPLESCPGARLYLSPYH